jgi:hypothetical protein
VDGAVDLFLPLLIFAAWAQAAPAWYIGIKALSHADRQLTDVLIARTAEPPPEARHYKSHATVASHDAV